VTSGTYYAIGLGSDGRTYFGGNTIGIWVLKYTYSSEHYVRHYGEWVDVEEFTGSKLDKEKTTDAYVSKFFHDDGSGVEGGQWVRGDGAEIGALSRLGNRAVKRLVHVINGLNGLGTRLMHTVSKIYYTKDADGEAYTDADEVATVGDIDRYSNDEVVTGVWIDGKPVYKRTFQWTGVLSPANTDIELADLEFTEGNTIVKSEVQTPYSGGCIIPGMVYKSGSSNPTFYGLSLTDDESLYNITLWYTKAD
jgi:hypothetical protein